MHFHFPLLPLFSDRELRRKRKREDKPKEENKSGRSEPWSKTIIFVSHTNSHTNAKLKTVSGCKGVRHGMREKTHRRENTFADLVFSLFLSRFLFFLVPFRECANAQGTIGSEESEVKVILFCFRKTSFHKIPTGNIFARTLYLHTYYGINTLKCFHFALRRSLSLLFTVPTSVHVSKIVVYITKVSLVLAATFLLVILRSSQELKVSVFLVVSHISFQAMLDSMNETEANEVQEKSLLVFYTFLLRARVQRLIILYYIYFTMRCKATRVGSEAEMLWMNYNSTIQDWLEANLIF